MRKPIRDRLLAACKPVESGCWEWQRARDKPGGYGVIWAHGRQQRAHRVSYETFRGPIPDGHQVDHLCRNTGCINPDHLEPVTQAENLRRAMRIGHPHSNAPRTCRRGHDWSVTPPVVSRRADGREKRDCSVCMSIRNARRPERLRSA